MNKTFPLISIVIPTLNEERNIKKCLEGVFNQDYPKDKLEVMIVDDKSTDDTVKIAEKYPVKILYSGAHHAEISKMIGFQKAQGEFFLYLDADCQIVDKGFLSKLLEPMLVDAEIVGSFAKEGAARSGPPLERYLSFDPLQRDSIYQFFSPSIEDVIVGKKNGYYICEYKVGKIPPAGRCLYRKKELLNLVSDFKMFLELDFLVILTKNGFAKFAYVPNAGLLHHHAPSLSVLLKKRSHNLTKVYFVHVGNRLFTWFDLTKPRDLLKLISWILFANLFIPSVLIGIYKSVKHKDWAGMYEPIVNLLVTDVLILAFLKDIKKANLLFKI